MNTVSSIVLACLMLILAIGMCSLVVEEWQEPAGCKIAYKLLLGYLQLFDPGRYIPNIADIKSTK